MLNVGWARWNRSWHEHNETSGRNRRTKMQEVRPRSSGSKRVFPVHWYDVICAVGTTRSAHARRRRSGPIHRKVPEMQEVCGPQPRKTACSPLVPVRARGGVQGVDRGACGGVGHRGHGCARAMAVRGVVSAAFSLSEHLSLWPASGWARRGGSAGGHRRGSAGAGLSRSSRVWDSRG